MNKERILEISESRFLKITYSAIVALGVVLFGFAAWMTSVELNAQEQSKGITRLQSDQDKVGSAVLSIDKRLSRIEVLLERKSN